MRAGFHESQTQRETFDAEAKRYKVLLITFWTMISSKLLFLFLLRFVEFYTLKLLSLFRFQDLYESELKSKDKLASRLYKANEKMAESQAQLK